jgi:hypothetical protein
MRILISLDRSACLKVCSCLEHTGHDAVAGATWEVSSRAGHIERRFVMASRYYVPERGFVTAGCLQCNTRRHTATTFTAAQAMRAWDSVRAAPS